MPPLSCRGRLPPWHGRHGCRVRHVWYLSHRSRSLPPVLFLAVCRDELREQPQQHDQVSLLVHLELSQVVHTVCLHQLLRSQYAHLPEAVDTQVIRVFPFYSQFENFRVRKLANSNHFSGHLGFVLAVAGSAVGVGNLWRFPYLAAKDGGGLFLLIYFILVLTFGFTLLTSDIAIGRRTKKSAIGACTEMRPKWKFLGIVYHLYHLTGGLRTAVYGYYCLYRIQWCTGGYRKGIQMDDAGSSDSCCHHCHFLPVPEAYRCIRTDPYRAAGPSVLPYSQSGGSYCAEISTDPVRCHDHPCRIRIFRNRGNECRFDPDVYPLPAVHRYFIPRQLYSGLQI